MKCFHENRWETGTGDDSQEMFSLTNLGFGNMISFEYQTRCSVELISVLSSEVIRLTSLIDDKIALSRFLDFCVHDGLYMLYMGQAGGY